MGPGSASQRHRDPRLRGGLLGGGLLGGGLLGGGLLRAGLLLSAALAGCSAGTHPASDAGSHAASDAGSLDAVTSEPCVPEGLAVAPPQLAGAGVELELSLGDLRSPGSTCGTGKECRSKLKFGLRPRAPGDPPPSALQLKVNGCRLSRSPLVGEEYVWFTQDGDPAINLQAGRYLVLSVERQGAGTVLRRSFAMPANLPRLLSPPGGAHLSPPVRIAWTPLGLSAVPDVVQTELRVTASGTLPGSIGAVGPTVDLNDADGQYDWAEPSLSSWTEIQLLATITYAPRLPLTLTFTVAVNPP